MSGAGFIKPTCQLLTLNNMRKLFKIVSNGQLSQLTFLERLPKEISSIFFPQTADGAPNKAGVSSLFNHNVQEKVVVQRYYRFKSRIINREHNTLNRTFFESLKESCKDYADRDAWENIEVAPDFFTVSNVHGEVVERMVSPLELLVLWFEVSEEYDEDNTSFKSIFMQTYFYYKENPTQNNLSTMIAYAILCSIFPKPDVFLNGYSIPPLFTADIEDFKNKKSNTFKKHPAAMKIQQILCDFSYCVVIGTHGCGKESIVNAFESYYADGAFSTFYYYNLSYDTENRPKPRVISPVNLDESVASINIDTRGNSLPTVIVLSNWNGKKDMVFRKLLKMKRCKIIFLTPNSLSKKDVPSKCCIDLNQEYLEARRASSKAVFLSIYGSVLPNENENLNILLDAIDYHFFATVILARSMCQKGLTISEKVEMLKHNIRIFEESDILPYIRNLGLDYISSTMVQYLTLLCITPPEGITKNFYSVLVLDKQLYKNDYEKCMETSLLQENPDGTGFRICSHIKQALMGLTNFTLENERIFQLIIRIADIAEVCSEDIQYNEFKEYSQEILAFVKSILKIFPYKPAQFTSAYIALIRFLWISDKPRTALLYLTQMKKSITKVRYRFIENDLAQIYLTMGYVYNSIGDYQNAEENLKLSTEIFAKQYTSSHSLQLRVEPASFDSFTPGLNVLDIRRKIFTEESYEFYITKLQICWILLKQLSGNSEKEKIFQDAEKQLNECCEYFESHDCKAALATSLFLRVKLLRKHKDKDFDVITNDLNKAKQLRASIRGKYHSWMISIYMEEAEVHMELSNKNIVEDYVTIIDKILEEKTEIKLTKIQNNRIQKVKAWLSLE